MLCHCGLVMEGGGMKGVFTAGVLDFFLDHEIFFDRIYAVSAAAAHSVSYMSGQRGRAYATFTDYLDRWDYCSLRSLLLTGDIFNAKTCYEKIPRSWNPLNYDRAARYPGRVYAVVSNLRTGKPEYLRLKDFRRDMIAVHASGAMPLVARIVKIGGEEYLDGGMTDAIPIRRSIEKGCRKNVVILTKTPGYRCRQEKSWPLMKLVYRRYPAFLKAIEEHPYVYNDTMDALAAWEDDGTAFVLRPWNLHGVGRIDKDPDQLKELYQEGYSAAEQRWQALSGYLEDTKIEERQEGR